jgi:single-strand DNA-binding protein
MNETYVTVQGWLGNDVELRQAGETPVATFRVASTPRYWSRRDRGWTDGDTTWFTVNAWRSLGEHCAASLRRADPVVVHGRLTTQVWKDQDDRERVTLVVEAVSVGHDLSRGTSAFTRAARPAESDDADLREHNAALGSGGPQVSSIDGEEVPAADETAA